MRLLLYNGGESECAPSDFGHFRVIRSYCQLHKVVFDGQPLACLQRCQDDTHWIATSTVSGILDDLQTLIPDGEIFPGLGISSLWQTHSLHSVGLPQNMTPNLIQYHNESDAETVFSGDVNQIREYVGCFTPLFVDHILVQIGDHIQEGTPLVRLLLLPRTSLCWISDGPGIVASFSLRTVPGNIIDASLIPLLIHFSLPPEENVDNQLELNCSSLNTDDVIPSLHTSESHFRYMW